MSGDSEVREYFSDHALEWGRHYQGTGLPLVLFNRVFRRGLKQRWDITMKRAAPVKGMSFLDVGCGTGVYTLALAAAGAGMATGMDFAPGMIEAARAEAARMGLDTNTEFLTGAFMNHEFDRKFDLVFAMGVFDYLTDYLPFWNKMTSLAARTVVASFPTHDLIREPVRKLRYRIKGLPVHFYSREQIEELGRVEGIKSFEIEPIGGGCVLSAFMR